MNLSQQERLQLINQFEILSIQNENDASHYQELIKILQSGYTIFYNQVFQHLSEEMSEESCKLVLNILDLYRAIEDTRARTASKELDDHRRSTFLGFDGNSETEYMCFARFLVVEQGKFREQEQYLQKNDNMNSHMPMIEIYRRMLIAAGNYNIWEMSAEDALNILNA
ncbi:hypothetical protein N473_07750 [Pseudoalteromonas luteoviolacea CPMOR-1]|uniref:YfbU family protein n=1 Tax=Pseudoalteromonas luteoviolacea CPMOR-1 TaxID=1365248 RepID=A0A167NHV9_9GAMM|nr:YfbU family protein [Pseudoalteromonas luteoviolacea]KZN68309.1 hypothetical protein N473_07750 [Pseudoalteromonas luteoviolacea CPMOR-1]